ncbi:MAG: MFS transporter [Limimaricola sp.]|uniref:MFS transporter n=1 Tax=Limimaricola sp. TaxID=2211665 RepID=UPI001DCB3187|nr:MFS transporter [Limimaricola sp.]MBI1416001.1 MFS transporter [Limimaricola sp.]
MSLVASLSLARRPATAFAVVGAFWGAFAAYVPVIKARLGADDGLFGLLLLGSATGLLTAMWLAPVVDRWLGARGMQAAAVLFALAWFLPGLVHSVWLFPVAMFVVGTTSGLLDVIMNSRVSDLEARHGRSLMNGAHGMFSLGYGLSAVLCSFTREAGLPLEAVIALLATITLVLLPMMKTGVDRVAAAEGHVGGYPLWPILLCGGVTLIAFMSEATVEAWSALHIERTLHGGAAEGALGPAMLGLTMAFGRFGGQVVAERMAELAVIVRAAVLSALGAAIAATATGPAMAYLGFGILGLGVSVIGPMALALVGKMVAPHLRTEAISRAAVMGFSGLFLAPVFMGLLSQAFGLRVAYGCVALLLLGALPLARAIAALRRAQPA